VLSNTDHQLVWNVGADWNIDLGQLKFEIICKDSRGLLPFEWLAIPATATTEAMTISKNTITDTQVLNALFYQYSVKAADLSLSNGVLYGTVTSGAFRGIELANGATVMTYALPCVMKQMNLQPALPNDVSFAIAARCGITSATGVLYAQKHPYIGVSNLVVGVGANEYGQLNISGGSLNITTLGVGYYHSLALKSDGTVVGCGYNGTVPAGLSQVTGIAAGCYHSLALKGNGTVVAWGNNDYGQSTIPIGLSNVKAIGAGRFHSLALKSDGTVVAWGNNDYGQCTVPIGLSNVTAIAAGGSHCLALKRDGTVVAWGCNGSYQSRVPVGLSSVTALAAGDNHSLALKGDGTVVTWGSNGYGQCALPAGLSTVTSISAGADHSLALKGDGTVVAWGRNDCGQCNMPTGINPVSSIGGGYSFTLLIVKEP
jgi:alpha-tubulin suppressor-like RCC1 family protein